MYMLIYTVHIYIYIIRYYTHIFHGVFFNIPATFGRRSADTAPRARLVRSPSAAIGKAQGDFASKNWD